MRSLYLKRYSSHRSRVSWGWLNAPAMTSLHLHPCSNEDYFDYVKLAREYKDKSVMESKCTLNKWHCALLAAMAESISWLGKVFLSSFFLSSCSSVSLSWVWNLVCPACAFSSLLNENGHIGSCFVRSSLCIFVRRCSTCLRRFLPKYPMLTVTITVCCHQHSRNSTSLLKCTLTSAMSVCSFLPAKSEHTASEKSEVAWLSDVCITICGVLWAFFPFLA